MLFWNDQHVPGMYGKDVEKSRDFPVFVNDAGRLALLPQFCRMCPLRPSLKQVPVFYKFLLPAAEIVMAAPGNPCSTVAFPDLQLRSYPTQSMAFRPCTSLLILRFNIMITTPATIRLPPVISCQSGKSPNRITL